MSLSVKLKEAREKYQEKPEAKRLKFEDIAKSIFPGPAGAAAKKLQAIEKGAVFPSFVDAQQILNHYGLTPAQQLPILLPYRLAEQLAGLAERSGYTKTHLATQAGFSYHHFMRILKGGRQVTSADKLLKICKAVKATPEETRELMKLANFEDFDHMQLDLSSSVEQHDELVTRLRNELSSPEDGSQAPSVRDLFISSAPSHSARGSFGITKLAAHLVREQAEKGKPLIKISLGRRFVGDPKLLRLFLDEISTAISNGASVQCLLPMPLNAEQAFKSVSRSLLFLSVTNGKYEVRLDPATRDAAAGGRIAEPARVMILPSHQVLLFLPSEYDSRDDSAMVIEDKEGLIEQHFDRRFEGGVVLATLFRSKADDPVAFQRALREAEADDGPRLIIRRRPPNTMMPPQYWEWESEQLAGARRGSESLVSDSTDPWLFERLALRKAKPPSPQAIKDTLARLHDEKVLRRERMVESLHYFPLREIYPKKSLTEYFTSKNLPQEVRLGILDELITWLQSYDNYEIALSESGPLTTRAFFGIHGDQTVFLSVWRPDAQADYLQVKNEHFVQAFRDYFIKRWGELPASDRSKPQVLGWLARLRAKVAGS